MIILDPHSQPLHDFILRCFGDASPKQATIPDFDGARIEVSKAKGSSTVDVSLLMYGLKEFVSVEGMSDKFHAEYAQEDGFEVRVLDDSMVLLGVTLGEELSDDEKEKVAMKTALIKRNVFAASFSCLSEVYLKTKTLPPVYFPYRGSDEVVMLSAAGSSLSVVFSLRFRTPDEFALTSVFMREFADSLKGGGASKAPITSFSPTLPKEVCSPEIEAVVSIGDAQHLGFMTFVLFERHLTGGSLQKTIDLLSTFRAYVDYHLKCLKEHLHRRMRTRVEGWVKVLNRARPSSYKSKA
jgi:actin related protein 2/3 complex, subunit 2